MVCLGCFALIYFQPENRGYTWLFVLLSILIVYKLPRTLHEWYHYWNVVPAVAPPRNRQWTVDVLTTFCPGEPYEMILETLRAIQAITYPPVAVAQRPLATPLQREPGGPNSLTFSTISETSTRPLCFLFLDTLFIKTFLIRSTQKKVSY
ncbi:hypothetical protein LX87_05410 [Larkinella arboricola]|uniref:Uncharacterized protein n=1 Tax=Larkinella arboricola TaxID=643671 RepID=A0A327WKY3_LARAB|nr:hypothetical protein [Larkinella arboricola]RAJ90866.1 hypothetical protein LX87_05410 [Larkinella arboricola]